MLMLVFFFPFVRTVTKYISLLELLDLFEAIFPIIIFQTKR